MFGLGWLELLLILLLVVMLFGIGRLPRVMEELGRGIAIFRKSLTDQEKTDKDKDEK